MNKLLKFRSLGILAFLIVLAAFSFVGANGPLNLIVNSPVDGSSYDINDNVLFSANIITSSNLEGLEVSATVELPDGNYENFVLVQSGSNTVYEAYFTPSMLGTHKTLIHAEDNSGNWDSENITFYVTEEVNSSYFSLILNSPEIDSVWDISDEVLFSANVLTASNMYIEVGADIECDDGTTISLILENDGFGNYEAFFSPNSVGTCKAVVYAEDISGNQEIEETLFYIEDGFVSEFDLIVINPTDGEVFDCDDPVNMKVEVHATNDVEIKVLAEIEDPEGDVEVIELTSQDNFEFIGVFDNADEEGEYKITFKAKDALGNNDEKIVYFEIENCGSGGSGGSGSGGFGSGGSGSGGSGAGLDDKYYLCMEWSDWFDCVDGVQDRVCVREVRISDYQEGATLTSQLWEVQQRTCELNVSGGEDDESDFKSWITGSVTDFFSSTGTLIVLIVFVLLLLILLLILAMARRKF